MSKAQMDKLLKPAEAAAIIGLSESYVYQLIAKGEIKAERYPYGSRTRPRVRESVARQKRREREIPDALPAG